MKSAKKYKTEILSRNIALASKAIEDSIESVRAASSAKEVREVDKKGEAFVSTD